MASLTGESACTASRQFSPTVSVGKRFEIWNVRVSPSAARRCVGMRVTSRPNNSMRPSVTGSAPAIRLNSVVLPAPLGPMSARRSPGRTASSTPSTARSPPKTFETRSRRSAQSLRRRASLTVLARRIVPAVQRPLQVLVRLVLPELGDGRVGGDDGVLQPVLALDLPDVDVLDHAVVVVDAERTARRVGQS